MENMKNKILLYNNDCLDKKLLDSIKDNSIDVIFTSPPYNLGSGGIFARKNYPQNKYGESKYKKDINLDNNKNWKDWITEVVLTWLEKTEYFFLNLQSLSPNKKDIIEVIFRLKDHFVDRIIWDKGSGLPTGFQKNLLMPVFEDIYIFKKNSKNRKIGTKEFNSGSIKNLIHITKNKNKYAKIHQAIFPEELANFIFKSFVKNNGIVGDIFLGTGTSAIVAKKLNLSFIGVEIDKDYFEIAKQRINEK